MDPALPVLAAVPPPDALTPADLAVPLLGEIIAIVAIVFGIGLVMLRVYLDFRRRRELYQLHHAERMAAIEKGIELPPLPADFFRDARRRAPATVRQRRYGLVLLFVGLTVGVALWASGERGAWWGLVPAGWGVALLLAGLLERRETARASAGSEPRSDGGVPDPPSS